MNDETGYNAHYKGTGLPLDCDSPDSYQQEFERRFLTPFAEGGWTVSGHASKAAFGELARSNPLKILDAGSGKGELSVYLACLGHEVTGIEISQSGVDIANRLAQQVGVQVTFVVGSLAAIPAEDNTYDVIVGRNTLHHFVKYPCADELARVAKPGALGIFVDPWGENRIKNLFQNKEQMEKLGDTLLTLPVVKGYFGNAEVTPVTWFGLIDKALIRLFGWKGRAARMARALAKLTQWVDNKMPANRATLWLAGHAVTRVRY